MMSDPATQDPTPPQTPPRRWRWWGWLLLAAVLYTPFIDATIGSGNVASDAAAIESLVHRHTFFINGSPFEYTIDKFRREDGRFFSQKSPIFHLVAAVPYGALAAAGVTFTSHEAACLRVLTFLMVVLPMGWLLCLIFNHPWMARLPDRERKTLTLLFAAGSLLTPFAVTLNHYVLAAACLMAAVNRLTAEGLSTRRAALLAGWWVAASLACDVPPAFLFGAGLGLFSLVKAPRALPWLALGAAPLLLLYAALNQHIIGSPLPPNMHEEKMLYYPGSYFAELKAKAEAGHPGYYQASYARRLVHATVGHKGTYWMMPLITLATLAALALAWRRAPGWPLALAWAVFPPAAIALTMRWAWDLSGGAYNIRHILATIPPLYCVLAHPALPRPGRGVRLVLGAAAVWGCLVAWVGLMNPWSHNVLSAYPPLENLARWSLKHSMVVPTDWISGVIEATSVTPEVGWIDLGEELLGQRRLPEAERALKAAIAVKPDAPLPYYHLGIAQDMMGRPGDAIETYRRLLELEPKNLGGWNNLGYIALKVNNLALAREAYRQSQALVPDNPSAVLGTLAIGGMEGHPDEAGLRAAIKKFPQDRRFLMLAEMWGLAL